MGGRGPHAEDAFAAGLTGEGLCITVVGSINMDLVVRVPSIPRPGQTLAGEGFACVPGGKGANQAVALARLGAETHMIGRLGADDFGQRLLRDLQLHGVKTSRVALAETEASGVAMILVDKTGENAICVAGGANLGLRPEDVEECGQLLARSDALVLQFELPMGVVERTIELARAHQVPVVLDPGPARSDVPAAVFDADVIAPNQWEGACLVGRKAAQGAIQDLHEARDVALKLARLGPKWAVVKCGAKGAVWASGEESGHVPPFRTRVVDTTAAGDAFTAALAVAYARRLSPAEAVRFAGAAGALACTVFGAQPSMPFAKDVNQLLAEG